MAGKKDLQQFLKDLTEIGWDVQKKSHYKIRSPKGQLFTCSGSPGCNHAFRQLKRDIRRYAKDQETVKVISAFF